LEITQSADSTLKIRGELIFDTTAYAFEQLSALLKGGSHNIDLSEVERVDSSALALLTALMGYAERKKIILKFVGLPQELIDLARVSGLDGILPLA
jgi:phospholipid transport system transporter-binding protein